MQTPVLGVDFGYGHVKAILDEGREGSPLVVFPHALGSPDDVEFRPEALTKLGGGDPLVIGVGDEERQFFVGELAVQQSTYNWASLTRSRDAWELRAMLAEALMRLNVQNGTEIPLLVSGLPPAMYAETRDDHINALSVVLRFRRGASPFRTVDIQSVKVVPQPAGSYYSLALSPDGYVADQSLIGGPDDIIPPLVAVLDIGHFTTDGLEIEGGTPRAPSFWSVQAGMSKLLTSLRANVAEEYGADLTPFEADAALRAGYAILDGEKKSLPVENEIGLLAEEILSTARSRWGDNGSKFHHILLTGGGAEVLKTHIQQTFSRAEVVPSPQTANVQGYVAYGRAALGRQKQERGPAPA